MPAEPREAVVYWDASAVLSALVRDGHTVRARRALALPGPHLLSSLAFAEAAAVLGRLGREGRVPAEALGAALEALGGGPWRWLAAVPAGEACRRLSARHALRGADLWHLALAASLREDLPELRLLTFDSALGRAAAAEGLRLP